MIEYTLLKEMSRNLRFMNYSIPFIVDRLLWATLIVVMRWAEGPMLSM